MADKYAEGEILKELTKRRLIVPESAVPDIPDAAPPSRKKLREMSDRGMSWCALHAAWEYVGIETAWQVYRGEIQQ